MKKILTLSTAVILGASNFVFAAPVTSRKPAQQSTNAKSSAKQPATAKPAVATASPYKQAMGFYQKQDYRSAAILFYRVIFQSQASQRDKMVARYYFGVCLMKLGLYQTAAFPLIMSTKDTPPKLSQKAFENLVVVSEKVEDSTLLDYTLKRLNVDDLSEIGKELYYNRLAEVQMKDKNYAEALATVAKSLQINPSNEETMYLAGLINMKAGKTNEGVVYYEKLYDKYFVRPATDPKRGLSALALGRAYYQAKRWEDSANIYRQIPKDHAAYRQAQLELSWSLFRAAKFRSAMSTTQTLHTPFYENFYDPESLILRAIILLFVCQADEADKALQTFQKTYTSTYSILADINESNQPPEFYFSQVKEAQKYLKSVKNGEAATYTGQIPFFLVRTSMDQAPLKNRLTYLNKITLEKQRLGKIFATPAGQPVLKYGNKILDERIKNASKEAGQALKQGLYAKEQELALLSGDLGMLRYEVLNGKKQEARSEYVKSVQTGGKADQINADDSRDFYIKNGYRYWPFEGEFWRDEIGNYQYLGVNRCADEK